MAEELDAAGLLPDALDDDEDLFYSELLEHAPTASCARHVINQISCN
jgi:hypothetical protein